MKNRSFMFLWVGQMLANCGDVLYIVGMIASIYHLTQSTFMAALFPFTSTFAMFMSGLLAPILIDKSSLKSLLVFSQIGKTVTLLLVCFYYYFNDAISLQLVIIFIFVFCISFLDGWARPARNAMLPRLVHSSELVKANSFISVIDQVVQMGGWAFGGLLVAFFGGFNVIVFTLFLYIGSSVMMLYVQDRHQGEGKGEKYETASVWQSLIEGWKMIWRVESLRKIHTILFLESIANTVWIAAVLFVYVEEQLKVEEVWWGYINASFFLGLMFGGMIGMRKSEFIERKIGSIIFWMGSVVGISTILFGVNIIPWLALCYSAIFGLAEQLKSIALQTLLQKSVGLQQLPKVYASQGALLAITFGVASLVIGYLIDITDVEFSFVIAGYLLLISTIYSYMHRTKLTEDIK